jgi:pyruvate/2-oxoglutarate dehydrogenase complex dihydrolipoamide dehydrogenase (E3) component
VTSGIAAWDCVIIGAGTFGLRIATALAGENARIALVEQDQKLVTQIEESQSIRELENLKLIFGHGFFDEAGHVVVLDPETGDEQHVVSAPISVIACGTGTSFLGLSKLGVTLDQNLAIPVDDSHRTAAPKIYAAGACSSCGGNESAEAVAMQFLTLLTGQKLS